MQDPIILVNCTGETLTPGNSGAICTWVWQMRAAAERAGYDPLIISRSCPHPQYLHRAITYLDYPYLPPFRGAGRYTALERAVMRWQHVRHKPWFRRVAAEISRLGGADGTLVFSNDPELVVWARRAFPRAFIAHNFQNQNQSPRWSHRRFRDSIDLPFACSRFTAQWNERYFRCSPASVYTVYNGVDGEQFRPAQKWDEPNLIVTFVGRTDSAKAPDTLLTAAEIVARHRRDFEIRIIGRPYYDRDHEDDYTRGLRRQGQRLGQLGVGVRFVGWLARSALPSALGESHVNVVPSRWDEAFGLVVAEGMAAGCATIAARSGGIPEVVGNAGSLFGRGQPGELAEILLRLLGDRNLCRRFSTAARNRALEFSWDASWSAFARAATEARMHRAGA